MGNNQEKPQDGDSPGNERRPTTAPLQPPAVSQKSINIFLENLGKLPITLTEEQFETIIYDLVEKTFAPGTVILKEGQPAVGLFVITEGICNVLLADDGVTVIKQLEKGDIFGEISCFYNNSCSCTVSCGDDINCSVIYLTYEKIQNMIMNIEIISMKQWLIEHKYIDLACSFPIGEISEAVIKNSMLQTPLFCDWSEEAVYSVYKSLQPAHIEIYSPSKMIFFSEDQMACGYLLIFGEMELFNDNDHINISAKNESIWFGDEQLFCNNSKLLSARAVSPCQVLVFTPDSVTSIMKEFSIEAGRLINTSNYWKKYLEMRDNYLYKKYALMDVTFLSHTFKKSVIFNGCNNGFVYYIALSTFFKLVNKGEIIMENHKSTDNEPSIVIILAGCAEVVKTSDTLSDLKLYPKDCFYFNKASEINSHIKAVEETLVGFVSKSMVENVKNIYPETLVDMDW